MGIQSGFNFLPREVQLKVFSYLPFKSVIQANHVSKVWNEILEDSSIWHSFYQLLGHSTGKGDKSVVIKEVISLKKITTENQKAEGSSVHIRLSRLGLSSLQVAHECIRNITKEEEENNPYEKGGAYYALGFEYLGDNLLEEAETVAREISPDNISRAIIAYNTVRIYLQRGNLEKAFSVMQYITREQLESWKTYSIFIDAVIKANKIDLGFQCLEKFKTFNIHNACVRQFANFLVLNDLQKFEELSLLYSKAIIEKSNDWDVTYFIYTKQIEKAEDLVLILPDIGQKIHALEKIKQFYNNSNNKTEENRIGEWINACWKEKFSLMEK